MAFLPDILAKLTTFCSPHLRHMGYLNEALGMRSRSWQRRAAWQPHLDNTRRAVLSAARACPDRQKAVVLGSGLLLDLPLAELSSLFREVVLMDVICLPEVRREIRKYANVTFLEHEVTGIAEQLYLNRHRGIRELPLPEVAQLPGSPADFVVSLNILSQLWVVPRMFALSEFPGIAKERIEEWCSQITRAHWRLLEQTGSCVCIVADYAFMNCGSTGEVRERGSTIGSLSLPDPDETWTWLIDPGESGSLPIVSRELVVGVWKRGYNSSDRSRTWQQIDCAVVPNDAAAREIRYRATCTFALALIAFRT